MGKPNAAMAELWNGISGQNWLTYDALHDRSLAVWPCSSGSEPEANGGEGDHGEVSDREFLAARRDAAVLLDSVDRPLDLIPPAVRDPVHQVRGALAPLLRDHRPGRPPAAAPAWSSAGSCRQGPLPVQRSKRVATDGHGP